MAMAQGYPRLLPGSVGQQPNNRTGGEGAGLPATAIDPHPVQRERSGRTLGQARHEPGQYVDLPGTGPHTVQNAAPISDWLWQLVQDDELLPEEHKPIILREIAGVSVTPPQQVQAQYGALACIWRESVYRYLSPGQSATPITALMQLDVDQRPVIDPWIGKHGVNEWVTALIERVYLPVMHMLWHHGTALESHAQNMLLVHEDGLPIKVALKDFHDGVRYSRALLANAAALPDLTDAPQAHARVNPNSFLGNRQRR